MDLKVTVDNRKYESLPTVIILLTGFFNLGYI